MTLKGDAKFKEKLTCGLKNDLRNLHDFRPSSRKFGKLHFDELLLSKAYKNLHKKVQKSYVSWHWRVMQSLKKKLTLDSKNDVRNLVDFNVSSGKCKNLHFGVLLLSVAYKVSAKKVQKNYLSWHWIKRSKLWRKTDFLFQKWHEESSEFKPSSKKSENLHFHELLL